METQSYLDQMDGLYSFDNNIIKGLRVGVVHWRLIGRINHLNWDVHKNNDGIPNKPWELNY